MDSLLPVGAEHSTQKSENVNRHLLDDHITTMPRVTTTASGRGTSSSVRLQIIKAEATPASSQLGGGGTRIRSRRGWSAAGHPRRQSGWRSWGWAGVPLRPLGVQRGPLGAGQLDDLAAHVLDLGRAVVVVGVLGGPSERGVEPVLVEVSTLDQVLQDRL